MTVEENDKHTKSNQYNQVLVKNKLSEIFQYSGEYFHKCLLKIAEVYC